MANNDNKILLTHFKILPNVESRVKIRQFLICKHCSQDAYRTSFYTKENEGLTAMAKDWENVKVGAVMHLLMCNNYQMNK